MYYAKLIIAMEQIDFPSKNIVQNGRNLLVFLPEKKQSNVCLYYTIYFDCHVMDMNFLGCSYHTMKNETKLSCDLSKCFESEMTRKKRVEKLPSRRLRGYWCWCLRCWRCCSLRCTSTSCLFQLFHHFLLFNEHLFECVKVLLQILQLHFRGRGTLLCRLG